jgi:hypothetical protein
VAEPALNFIALASHSDQPAVSARKRVLTINGSALANSEWSRTAKDDEILVSRDNCGNIIPIASA